MFIFILPTGYGYNVCQLRTVIGVTHLMSNQPRTQRLNISSEHHALLGLFMEGYPWRLKLHLSVFVSLVDGHLWRVISGCVWVSVNLLMGMYVNCRYVHRHLCLSSINFKSPKYPYLSEHVGFHAKNIQKCGGPPQEFGLMSGVQFLGFIKLKRFKLRDVRSRKACVHVTTD